MSVNRLSASTPGTAVFECLPVSPEVPNGRVQPRYGAQQSNVGCRPLLGGTVHYITLLSRGIYTSSVWTAPSACYRNSTIVAIINPATAEKTLPIKKPRK